VQDFYLAAQPFAQILGIFQQPHVQVLVLQNHKDLFMGILALIRQLLRRFELSRFGKGGGTHGLLKFFFSIFKY
jgi:hypothetical protein